MVAQERALPNPSSSSWAADRYERLEPIPGDRSRGIRTKAPPGVVPEVEVRYGDLMRAIRTMRTHVERTKPANAARLK